MQALSQQQCRRNVSLLDAKKIASMMSDLHSDWRTQDDDHAIARTFHFDNYYQTVAFINAAVQVAHKQDHHPDIRFGYNRCEIRYSTHSVGGLSLNDFICAAKIDVIDAI